MDYLLQQKCSSDSDSDGENRVDLSEGLSSEALAALLAFMSPKSGAVLASPMSDGLCMKEPLTAAAMAAEISNAFDQKRSDPERTPANIEATEKIKDVINTLKKDGVVRMNRILELSLCDRCVADINSALLHAKVSGFDHYSEEEVTGFGNVDASGNRWDMYLKNTGSYKESIMSMFSMPTSPLRQVFSELFAGDDACFYEYAALTSDPGAISQRIHSDTTFQPECPLYTVFIALQDVDPDMGPTVFISGSNTEAMHSEFRFRKHAWLSESKYFQGVLNKGDIIIMDSRTFHCASANNKQRRTLLYFTLRNPNICDMGGGSLFASMKDLTLHQFYDDGFMTINKI